MRIAVIGAGIHGVTTAYELATEGHQVTVLERQGSIASQGSFAGAGLISPAYLGAWSRPGLAVPALTPWLGSDVARRWRLPTPARLRWLWRWRQAARAGRIEPFRHSLHELARHSQERLDALSRSLKLDYEQQTGQLVLLRKQRDLDRMAPGLRWLEQAGEAHQILDGKAARQFEPALNADTPLQAAIYLPGARAVNERQLAHLLKDASLRLGVSYRLYREVLGIVPGQPLRILSCSAEPHAPPRGPSSAAPDQDEFDAVVLCAGLAAPALLPGLSKTLPLASVQCHSITAPARLLEAMPEPGPRATVLDERHQVGIARLGQRIRVSGALQLDGDGRRAEPAALATLYKIMDDWFPGAARTSRAIEWRGPRPTTVDGLPVIGRSDVAGVWLNLGHGANAWSLACGAARLLADQMAARAPAVDPASVAPDRLR